MQHLLYLLEVLLVTQSLLHTWSPCSPTPEVGSKCTELVRCLQSHRTTEQEGFIGSRVTVP
jgi:hypothetical protein